MKISTWDSSNRIPSRLRTIDLYPGRVEDVTRIKRRGIDGNADCGFGRQVPRVTVKPVCGTSTDADFVVTAFILAFLQVASRNGST